MYSNVPCKSSTPTTRRIRYRITVLREEHSIHAQTGTAQGVAIAAALQRNIPIFEYAPKKIKMSITGTGEASKEQIAILLGKFMVMPDTISTLDETDAIAIAYCHHLQGSLPTTGSSKCKDWGDFIKQNPDKVL